MLRLGACMLGAAAVLGADGIAVCPGEGSRYVDHKCNHDPTHRVCAQLLDVEGQPLNWGKGNFWEITGQTAFQWDGDIRANNGDSWCICMWATAHLIEDAGCENVHIHCDSTDVAYVLSQYEDGGTDLSPAHTCLQQKCSAAFGSVVQQKVEADIPAVASAPPLQVSHAGLVALCFALLALGLFQGWYVAQPRKEEDPVE